MKNSVLAGLYRNTDIGGLLESAPEPAKFPETEEKFLRQILVACKRFNRTTLAEYKQLHTLLRDKTRLKSPVYLDHSVWETRLDLACWQMEAVFRHAIIFQLTSGCSNYCRRCNEWALPNIRGHFTRDAVLKMAGKLLALGNDDPSLYGGSDPLDWLDPPYDLSHILDRLGVPCRFSLLTKIPKGRQALARHLAETKIPISVSLTDRNRQRIEALEAEMGQAFTKQHATSDLLIPACLDEDFTTVKASITDSYGTEISMDGAFIIIPTFTSALHPFGHKKIPVTRETRFFPVKKLGRPALLVDYFKPLEVEGPQGRFHLETLLDVQVENILLDNGDYDLTPPGMRSVKEYFEIFDNKARDKRKQMTPSVVRRLKKAHLADRPSFQSLSPDQKNLYKGKIQAHLDFTRPCHVLSARVSAASFFLAAILAYVKLNPVNVEIIARLTRDEYDHAREAGRPGQSPLKASLLDPDQNAWHIFRGHALSLIHGGQPGHVDLFLSQWPAVYSPFTDLFLPGPITLV